MITNIKNNTLSKLEILRGSDNYLKTKKPHPMIVVGLKKWEFLQKRYYKSLYNEVIFIREFNSLEKIFRTYTGKIAMVVINISGIKNSNEIIKICSSSKNRENKNLVILASSLVHDATIFTDRSSKKMGDGIVPTPDKTSAFLENSRMIYCAFQNSNKSSAITAISKDENLEAA